MFKSLLSIKASFKGQSLYLPVVLILLIYITPLISLSVALSNTSPVAHLDSSDQSHDSHHGATSSHATVSYATNKKEPQSQSIHHEHGWCNYCDLLANIAAIALFALFIPMLTFALIARIKVRQCHLGCCFSHLFPTPRAPPVF